MHGTEKGHAKDEPVSNYVEESDLSVFILYKGIAADGKEPLMPQAEAYNEVDCKAMWEILGHLRRNH